MICPQKCCRSSGHFSQQKVCLLFAGYVRRSAVLVKWNQCGKTVASQVIDLFNGPIKMLNPFILQLPELNLHQKEKSSESLFGYSSVMM